MPRQQIWYLFKRWRSLLILYNDPISYILWWHMISKSLNFEMALLGRHTTGLSIAHPLITRYCMDWNNDNALTWIILFAGGLWCICQKEDCCMAQPHRVLYILYIYRERESRCFSLITLQTKHQYLHGSRCSSTVIISVKSKSNLLLEHIWFEKAICWLP